MAEVRICAVDGCDKRLYARGWCRNHYMRWRSHGSPLGGQTTVRGDRLRFARSAIEYIGPDCLIWPYSLVKGYGTVSLNNRKVYAHRFVCEGAHGPAPTHHHEVAHSCGESRCVNPTHLRWATHEQNEADKLAHGTRNSGERNGGAKLSLSDVEMIHSLKGSMSQSRISAIFGISRTQISRIHTGRRWLGSNQD